MDWIRIVCTGYDEKGAAINMTQDNNSWFHREQAVAASHRMAAQELVEVTKVRRNFNEPITFIVHLTDEDDAASIFRTDVRGFTNKHMEFVLHPVYVTTPHEWKYRECVIQSDGHGQHQVTSLFGEPCSILDANGLELLLDKIDELALERD